MGYVGADEIKCNKKANGREYEGKEWDEFPKTKSKYEIQPI
jgi:protein gp37